jgi:hypothetical protein
MPAKDIYHNTVKTALIKDDWTITKDPLRLQWGSRDSYVDLGAEKLFIAERKGRKIAVEVKSFVSRSEINDLQDALGQFVFYRFVMETEEPERELFLAIRESIYSELLEDIHGQRLIEAMKLKIIVFDELKEEIIRWIE